MEEFLSVFVGIKQIYLKGLLGGNKKKSLVTLVGCSFRVGTAEELELSVGTGPSSKCLNITSPDMTVYVART